MKLWIYISADEKKNSSAKNYKSQWRRKLEIFSARCNSHTAYTSPTVVAPPTFFAALSSLVHFSLLRISPSLSLPRHLLPLFPILLLPLLLQILPLLLRAHTLQPPIPELPLPLIALQLPLLGLLFLVQAPQLRDLGFARRADLAHDFGAETRARNEDVGEAQEVREEGKGRGVGGRGGAAGEAEGEG